MRNFKWLVFLMTFSLLGAAGVQAYWIIEAIQAREAQFNDQVTAAMQEVATRLEARENINLLMNNFRIDPIFPHSLNALVRAGRNLSAPANNADLNELRVSLKLDDDSVVLTNKDRLEWETNFNESGSGYNKEGKVIFSAQLQKDGIRITRKMYQLDSIFQKLVIQGFQKGIPLHERMDKKDLDSVIEFEFSNKGLPVDFEYAVLEGDSLSGLATEKFDNRKVEFQVPLFRNDVYGSAKKLLLHFPNKTRFLLSNMWTTLILALAFTIAIMLVSGMTLGYIIRQKRLNTIKTDFINNMTHEFKTPIATIGLAVDAMNNPKVMESPERLKHYAEVIKQENRRMNAQVEHVLRMALLDKNELELRMQEVDVNALAEEAASHLMLQVESRNGSLQLQLDAEPSLIKADPEHLGNVLVNILDNANKYSPDAPKIVLKTSVEEGMLSIAIQDQGMGMSRDVQKKIFERFYRVERGDIHNVKGHGLGLSYVMEMVHKHNGTISVQSFPGKGSTFTILLPLIQ